MKNDIRMTADPFDGVFDNQETGWREKYLNGELKASCHRNAIGSRLAELLGMAGPWGTFPKRPIESLRGECAG